MTTEGRSSLRIWAVGVGILLVLLWTGYWYTVQQLAANALERVTTARPDSPRIACSEKGVGGFPLRVDVRCMRASFAEPVDGGVAAELGGVKASAPLYWPGYVETTLEGPLVVNAPIGGLAMTAAWALGGATAEIGIAGLRRVTADLRSFDLANTGAATALPVKSLRADDARLSLLPGDKRSYRLSFATKALKITNADGRSLPALDGDLQATALDIGETLGSDPGGRFVEWLASGGTADIERFRLATPDSAMEATGKLTVSPAGYLNGSLVLRVRNLAALPQMIDGLRPGSREFVEKVIRLVSAFTLAVDTPEGPARQTTLNIREGVVAIGVIPIGTIPPLQLH